MKQNLLFNQLTAMPKRLAMVLTLFFTLGVGSVLGAALGDGYEKVTNISTLSAGDRVVLYCDDNSVGVIGWDGNKDAKVAASGWVEYLVESATGGVYLKDENASNYIASPGSSNQFKYGTKAVCTVNANGVLKCNNRFLVANGTYYRMYSSVGSYTAFYVYKVVTSTPVYNITVSSNDDSWGTANVSGNTITADPADCYQVKSGVDGYTIISGTATVTHDGNSNTLTLAASSDCSIQVNFEKKPVNTYIDNVQGNEEQKLCGDHNTPTLADRPQPITSTCEQLHWHFMGWVTEANKANPTDNNIVKAGASVTANGTTYYAVWAKGVTSGGASTSKQYSFDITPSNFNGTSYAANNNEKTSTAKASDNSTLEVKWTSNQVMLQNNAIQWQKSKGYIYNSTDLGTINSVTVTSTAGSYTTYYGQSEQPSSGTAGDGKGYFKTSVGSATGTASKVTVTFTITTQGGQTTTYSDYITQCTTEASVTLDLNGGSFDSKPDGWEEDGNNYTKTVNSGDQVTLPEPNKTGYDFEGWYNASTKVTSPYTLTGNTTLTAHWTPQDYTITYKDQGDVAFSGTHENNHPTQHTYGTATTLKSATKSGYNFLGWFTTANCSGSAITQLGATEYTGNITLYAKWEVAVITYTITCSVNDETITSKTYEQGATIEFPAVTPCDGMDLVGWTEIENYANETTAPSDLLTTATAEKTTTYYAVFAKLVEDSSAPYQLVEADRADWSGKYLIAYNDQTFADGRIGGKTVDGSIGETGHNIDLSSYIDGNNIPSENGDPYHLNLVSCEGGGYLLQTQDGKYNYYSSNATGLNANTKKDTAEPYKLNVIFNNSNDIQLALSGDAAGSVFHHNPSDQIFQFYKNASMSPVYLYRQNEVYRDYSTRCKYTVTFDANGHGEAPESQVVYKNELATKPDENPQGEGYNFQGWYDNQQCTGNAYDFATPITDNITLYAKWTPCVYTITYKDQGNATFSGSHESGNPTQHTYGTATTLKGATKTGYTFGGWYKEAACTNKVTSLGATEYTANITLYAKWTVNSYTVTWNPNGGNWGGSTDSKKDTYNYGATITKPGDPTRDGYRFDGWGAVAGTMPANNLEYTAQWTPTYTITWLANGHEFHKQENAVEGTALELPDSEPAIYACDDKVFVGWTATSITGTKDDEPADLFTTKNINVEDAATTYYAVFATADAGGSTTDTYDWESDQTGNWTVDDAIKRTQDEGTDGSYAGRINTINTYVTYNDKVAVTNFSFDFKRTSNNANHNVYIETSPDKSTWTAVATYPMTDFGNGSYTSKSHTFDGTQDLYVRFYCNNTTAIRYVDNVSITYGGTSYSDYVTTCAVIPDPVWGGAVINRNSIKVDCGSMTKLNAADPNGPATISFPAATNHTLTYDITVTASEGFFVSTNKTDAAKYGASVTVSPNKTGDNAGKITQNVYVVAVAPAQSDEEFNGTITISGKQITTQTINVTADVTCTGYTLTLVDRGVSTLQLETYFAGQTIDEAPADPEGVCTDPIHYVFDGWADTTVTNGSTGYTPVSFPYIVTGNTQFYAVYRYTGDGGEPSNDFIKVTSAKDDWTGDYVIVNEDADKAIGNAYKNTNTLKAHDVTINDNKVVSPANEVIWQIRKNGEYYTMYNTAAEKYAYVEKADAKGAGLSTTAQNMQIIFNDGIAKVSGVDIYRCFYYYGTNTEWRTYATGSYNTGALYCRSLETYLYTTSPVCGPHLAITEGKEIYVTGGNAGGTRDLVIAQQKVSYKATRLNVGPTSQVPDVKVATNGITVGGVVTSDVKVTIDQNKEQQTDGTYTITGTITVQYQPSANNKQEDIQVQLAVDYNSDAKDAFIVHARSLPQEFVIVAKQGDKWYALNGDMSNGSSANPANGQVTLDNNANPTKATYAPCNTIYTLDGVPNTGDRTRVRFQGTDGAWLWAASGTNVGIQNKSLKEIPEGNNKAYNWKLETEDNITYKFHNDNSSRLLGLSGEKFGMYASAVQELRILPYIEKCLYNYAPSNLIVKELKGSYVVLTWDAVVGATKYQYSTNAYTTWTDAGTEPTVTINGLEGNTKYTYYIRAYHEDAGVTNECIDYAEITFTTADCDDVPTDITYTADLNSITVSWTAAAPTATIKLFMDEEGTHLAGSYPGATSPYKISGGLNKNTTYYIQILADGTCASPIIPVKTEDVEVDIVEWDPQGIIVDINTDETVGVTLENEVSYGSGLGTEATELFFSKYYEASYNVKLVAIYNGTKNIIDLTDYTIQYGKTSWETNYITLKDFGATKGQIQPGEEIILYSMQDGTQDDDIMDCVHEDFPDGNWVEVTSSNNDGKGTLSFGGDKTIILCKTEYDDEADEYYDNIIDVIGALIEDPNEGILPTSENTEKPSWGDKEGWVCETGLSIADDSQIGISTNRCLLVRNNTVTSGLNAVAQNIEGDFVTLCSEWKGAQVPDSDIDNGVAASCENFAYVGTFDYSDYYTKYVSMGAGTTFEENDRNPDGTVTIPITDLYKHACSNIRIKLTDSVGEVLSDREYKVPIMITSDQTTAGQAFLDLQQNLATKEVDAGGNVINTYPLSLDEVREICKTCDVVIRDSATLTKVTDGTENDHPQVHDVIVYEGASIVIPDGINHNYTINSLSLRRKGDDVASAQVQGTGKLVLPADVPVTLNMRIDANNWHWFTLPYDCDIADVTWSDGTPAKYNTDWFLMYYDGESRAASTNPYDNHWKVYNGDTIKTGKGYIVGITGDLAHPDYTFELRFPMEQDVLTAEQTNKTVALNAWGVQSDNTPNNKGWNLVGNPYLNYYKKADEYSYEGLPLLQYTGIDPVTGDRLYDDNGNIPFLVTPVDGGWYEYRQELASEVNMMPFTAYFVQVGDPANPDHTDGKELNASFKASNRGKKSIVRRAPREVEEIEEPIIVRVELTNSKGESDKTSLVIDDRFTNEYEMNGDFFKWFGDYYNYYTKPVLYTIGADQGKRAFNALNEELAKQPIPMGMYAAQAGNYTFSLNQQFDLSRVEEVWLYDATENVYTNLMQQDYTFSTTKVNGEGRFSLSVKMMPELSTEIENIKQGNIWATTRNNEIVVNGLSKGMQLWIYDATGKLLHSDRTTNYQHSYGIPQTGAYFIRVHNNNEAQTITVVVE